MPLLSRIFLKCALLWLAVGLLGGIVTTIPDFAFRHVFHSVYIHALTVGWLSQLIFGVAYWMFPRYSKANPFGAERLAWGVFVMLNVGLLARAVAEPAALLTGAPGWGGLVIVSALLQFGAGVSFVIYIWGRVKSK